MQSNWKYAKSEKYVGQSCISKEKNSEIKRHFNYKKTKNSLLKFGKNGGKFNALNEYAVLSTINLPDDIYI